MDDGYYLQKVCSGQSLPRVGLLQVPRFFEMTKPDFTQERPT
jgi:hypothetical protein